MVVSLWLTSSSKRAKGKSYNEKIQFAKMIIQYINITRTYVVEFLCRSKRCWCVKEQIGPRATSIDVMFIEESQEDKAME